MVRGLIDSGRWIAAALLPIGSWVAVSSAVEPALRRIRAASREWLEAALATGDSGKILPLEIPIWPQATFFTLKVVVMAATGLLARKHAEPVHLCNVATVSMVALLLCAQLDWINGHVTLLRVGMFGLFGFLLASLIWIYRRRNA